MLQLNFIACLKGSVNLTYRKAWRYNSFSFLIENLLKTKISSTSKSTNAVLNIGDQYLRILLMGDTKSLDRCGKKHRYQFILFFLPWKCHGSAIEVPWKCHGSAVEVLLKCRWSAFEVQTANSHSHRPSPANSPTVHSRLVQNRTFWLGSLVGSRPSPMELLQ